MHAQTAGRVATAGSLACQMVPVVKVPLVGRSHANNHPDGQRAGVNSTELFLGQKIV